MYWTTLDGNADFVRIFSFEFSKAFNSVSHRILVSKLRDVDIKPYILNWLISFISNRKQQVVVDNIIPEYIDITRGVPHGTLLGPIFFSLMINYISRLASLAYWLNLRMISQSVSLFTLRIAI